MRTTMTHSLTTIAVMFTASLLPLPTSAQTGHLGVTAAVMPRDVSHGGLVQLDARIRNISKSRTVVLRGEPGWTSQGGVSLRITDASGNTRSIAPEAGGLSAAEARDGKRKLSLKPGDGVNLTRQLLASELFPRPGTYTVVVRYQSPLPGNSNRSVNASEAEGESAESAPLAITVR